MKKWLIGLMMLTAAVTTWAGETNVVTQTWDVTALTIVRRTVFGRPVWLYVAMAAWICLSVLVAHLADILMTRWMKRLHDKTKSNIMERLLEKLHRPVKLMIVLLMVHAGVQSFGLPRLIYKGWCFLFITGMVGAVVYVLMQLLDLFLEQSKEQLFAGDKRLAGMMVPVISRTLKVFIGITGALMAAQYLGLPVTSVVAGLGVGGIAVALAAQNTLANIFGAISILVDRPFRVGDFVKIQEFDGVVEEIGLRSTRIRTLNEHLVTLPNKTVVDAGIVNLSRRTAIRRTMTIGLTYDTSAERMQEAAVMLKEIFAAHPLTRDVWVSWRDYSASSLDIFIVYWCRSTAEKESLVALEEINLEIKRRFDKAGLQFAYPTQTIYLRQENA
jgi:MscS family membrane protein